MHLGYKPYCLVIESRPGIQLGLERQAWIVPVGIHGECSQGQKVDAVAVLEGLQVGIAEADSKDIGHTGGTAGGGSHPEQVVVAPLEVHIMVLAEQVHNLVRPWTAVVDVADDVQRVDRQPLDNVGHGDDEVVGRAGGDDGIEDSVDILVLVVVCQGLMYEFLDDVGKFRRQGLPHLRAGVLRGRGHQHPHEVHDSDPVPLGHILLLGLDQLELALGIIDKGTQLLLLLLLELEAEELVHLALDCPGGIAQHMLHRVILAVQVGHEMLRTLGQVENRLEIDNLRNRRLNGRKTLGEQLQIFYVFYHKSLGYLLIR